MKCQLPALPSLAPYRCVNSFLLYLNIVYLAVDISATVMKKIARKIIKIICSNIFLSMTILIRTDSNPRKGYYFRFIGYILYDLNLLVINNNHFSIKKKI